MGCAIRTTSCSAGDDEARALEKLLKVYAVTHLRMILTPTLIGYEELTTVMESIG